MLIINYIDVSVHLTYLRKWYWTEVQKEEKNTNNNNNKHVIALLYRICSYLYMVTVKNKVCALNIRDTWVEFEGPLTTPTVKLVVMR